MTYRRLETLDDIRRACVLTAGHWIWLGRISSEGYARCQRGKMQKFVHRMAFELKHGPIAEGLEIDHLCRIRRCVNPGHLEAVTHRENMLRSPIATVAINARKEQCIHGHEFTAENTLMERDGHRKCRNCRNRIRRARYAARRRG